MTSPASESGFPSLPGYEILSELGRGGMGVVYKARQIALNRVVAVKVILVGAHASTDERRRFRTEAETVARLQHPNIVQVYELGEWLVPGTNAPTPYLVMEYCGGGNLDRRLKAGLLTPELAAGLVEALARAIHFAHEKRIVHRDLKPGNILFNDRGIPKIADFGMAKKLDEIGHTKSGTVMGTPAYMAPEQAQGKSSLIGPTTDVYALGALLYECLTGDAPFGGETPFDTVLAVINDPAPELPENFPTALAAICRRCLQKNPAERYPTAIALADDLRRFLGGQPVLADGNPRTRHRGTKLLLICIAVVVLLCGFGVWYFWRDDKPSGGGGLSGEAFQPTFRLPIQVGLVRAWETRAQNVTHMVFSPDTSKLALATRDTLFLNDLQKEAEHELKGHTQPVRSLQFTRDGNRLLTASSSSVRLWSVHEANLVREYKTQPAQKGLLGAAFFDNDREVLTYSEAGDIVRWERETGKLLRRIATSKGNTLHSLTVRPKSRQAVVILRKSDAHELSLIDLDTGATVRKFAANLAGEFRPVSAVFTPDGTRFVASDNDGKAHLWRITGDLVTHFDRHKHPGTRLVGCLDEPRALLAGREVVSLLDLTRGVYMSVSIGDHDASQFAVALTSDGRHAATASAEGIVRIWGLPAGRR